MTDDEFKHWWIAEHGYMSEEAIEALLRLSQAQRTELLGKTDEASDET